MSSAEVRQLQMAVDALDPDGIDGDELIAVMRIRARLDAKVARRLSAFDVSHEWAADGSKSAAGWLVKHCRHGVTSARRAIKVARQAREMPLAAEAWERGEITTEHVEVLARTRNAAHADEQFAAFEAALVDVASAGLPEDVATVARQWRDALDADRQDMNTVAAQHYEARYLQLDELLDGLTHIDGSADEDAAARIRRAVDIAYEKAHKENDPRSPGQQRLDALVMVCDHYTNCETPRGSGRQLMMLTDAPTYRGEAIGLCETDRGLRVSPETMRRFACDASISVVTVDENSEVLDMGRSVRTFTPAQRRALIAQYPTCVGIGCRVPAPDCEMHHFHFWERGGRTDLANGAPLCYYEHHLVHELGWRVERDPQTGVISWFRPDGTPAGTTEPRKRPKPIPISRPRRADVRRVAMSSCGWRRLPVKHALPRSAP